MLLHCRPAAEYSPNAKQTFVTGISTEMTTFQSINIGLASRGHISEATTPTTPRALPIKSPQPQQTQRMEDPSATTPTRQSFGGILDQIHLVSPGLTHPVFPAQEISSPSRHATLTRESSHRSVQSSGSLDVDMDDSDEDDDGSEGESIDGETGRPSKKKKGQKFFCTEFPPCKLSFTRSEHLARHIRYALKKLPYILL